MPRVKTGPTRRRHHKKILAATRGYRMTKSRLFKVAHEAYLHALDYAFRGRKDRKGDFRTLWIQRINIALRNINSDYSYSRFIKSLKDSKVGLDRKILAHLAETDQKTFKAIVEKVNQK